jgi:endonuclease/exonuclease/phosphatase family metal-dependent hydrolase
LINRFPSPSLCQSHHLLVADITPPTKRLPTFPIIHRTTSLLSIDLQSPLTAGLLVCSLAIGNGKTITVGNTHLDHISLSQRRTQLAHVAESLPSSTLLAGDLNTLRKSDYSDREWDVLCTRAAANNWSAPEDGGLEVLEQAGFRDCCADAAQGLRTAPVEAPLYRIDYFLAAGGFFREWAVESVRVAGEIDCSDHHPLILDIETRSKL